MSDVCRRISNLIVAEYIAFSDPNLAYHAVTDGVNLLRYLFVQH